jgi:hypothetical protein
VTVMLALVCVQPERLNLPLCIYAVNDADAV